MTPDMVTTIGAALVLLVGAIGKVLIDLRKIHQLVNSQYQKALIVIANQALTISSLTGTDGDKALAIKAVNDAKPKGAL